MTNKMKSWILLIIVSFSLVPFGKGQAEGPDRTFAEVLSLFYLGDAFLEEEASLDTAVYFPGLMAPIRGFQGAEGAEEMMNRMIHAAKQERNDLDANCRQLKRRYQSAGDQEAVQKLETYCKAERQRLTNRINFLRKLRGDRRKLLTRWWHSIKRSSANLWRRIGPLGRNILRKVGDEAFNTVVSGGSLNVGKLVKQTAKSVMRGKLKSMMYDGVARLLESQLEIARAAGVLEDKEPEKDEPGNKPEMENTEPTISFTGQSSFICDQWVGEGGGSDNMGQIPLDVNYDAGEFCGEASFPFVDSMDYPQTATYVYAGHVSRDGILVGKMNVTLTVNNVDVGFITFNTALAGIVSDDGRGIYLQTFQESNTDRLQLFEEGRAAVLRDPYFANSRGEPPTCR